ncbi:MAG: hypothetical protein DMG35_09025 [Acidobacteria bacterium]|nr:MAG: hypothetical protein DMG35_09025 [Acidobacteriota bacterium]
MRIRRFSLGTIQTVGAVALFVCLGTDAKIKDPSEYTLQVIILKTTQNENGGPTGYHGWGYANVSEGASLEGVFYKFEGCPFYVRPSTKSYMARWKKERKRLAIVVNGEGTQQVECELKVRMDGVVYSISPLGIVMSHEKK